MQSIVYYGRFAARAIVAGLGSEIPHRDVHTPSLATPHVKPLHLVTAAAGISKSSSPAQITPQWCYGDDACFIASHKSADVIGVADGVGGWRSYGVDPSKFPRSLMTACERLVKKGNFNPLRPVDILERAYEELLEEKTPLIGSCTACMITLDRVEQMLYTANLGDSGLLIVRKGEVVHRTEEQQHYFNTPFQLSVAPTVLEGVVLSDSPDSADQSSFGVKEGDIILVGTDGLFDNMSEEMILSHLSKVKGTKKENLEKVASRIAHEAHELAFDPDYMSPFAFHAAANGFQNVKGGKPDDITVVLSRVTQDIDFTD